MQLSTKEQSTLWVPLQYLK